MRIILFYILCFSLLLSSCQKQSEQDVIFYGDSHIARYDLERWFLDINSTNKGIGGQTIIQLNESIVIENNTNACIQIGTNDIIIHSNNRFSVNQIIDTVLNSYTNLFSTIALQQTNQDIYFTSVIPITDEYFANQDSISFIYSALNYKIQALLKKYGFGFIDINKNIITNVGYLNSYYSYDGLHLNEEGYRQLTYSIYETIH